MAHGHIGTTITSKRGEPSNVKVYRVYEKTVSWPERIACSQDMPAVLLMTDIALHKLKTPIARTVRRFYLLLWNLWLKIIQCQLHLVCTLQPMCSQCAAVISQPRAPMTFRLLLTCILPRLLQSQIAQQVLEAINILPLFVFLPSEIEKYVRLPLKAYIFLY